MSAFLLARAKVASYSYCIVIMLFLRGILGFVVRAAKQPWLVMLTRQHAFLITLVHAQHVQTNMEL